jgi:hypothetical protein
MHCKTRPPRPTQANPKPPATLAPQPGHSLATSRPLIWDPTYQNICIWDPTYQNTGMPDANPEDPAGFERPRIRGIVQAPQVVGPVIRAVMIIQIRGKFSDGGDNLCTPRPRMSTSPPPPPSSPSHLGCWISTIVGYIASVSLYFVPLASFLVMTIWKHLNEHKIAAAAWSAKNARTFILHQLKPIPLFMAPMWLNGASVFITWQTSSCPAYADMGEYGQESVQIAIYLTAGLTILLPLAFACGVRGEYFKVVERVKHIEGSLSDLLADGTIRLLSSCPSNAC